MKISKLNDYVRSINELLDIVVYVNKSQTPSLWKFFSDTLKNEITELHKFVCSVVMEANKIIDRNSTLEQDYMSANLTIKSQKGMLKKQGQEIVEQRKEIDRLKKIAEDKVNNLAPTKRYYVFLTVNNLITKSYDHIINVVETHNIHEYIGKHYFYGINDITSISYTTPLYPNQECENAFLCDGYTKLNEFTYIKRGENNGK